jgi:hypothetical protein
MNKVAATPLAGNMFPVSAVFVLLVLVGVNGVFRGGRAVGGRSRRANC